MPATRLIALLALLLAGLVYVGNAWSPSSYALVLQHLGASATGLVWGEPRAVRADEYAVVTPLTQATVNNGFARMNATSPYGEDLRINYGLPIHDWGLAFKPTLWLFGVVPPAYAFSFHWFAVAALFVCGYALLFRWIGASGAVAMLLAAGLFFTGCVQFWWSEKGPIYALFPWVLLPFATRLPLPGQAALFAWAAVAWLLTNFYPPVQLTLALVGAALLAGRRADLCRGRALLCIAFAAAAAAGVAAAYLWEYLSATSGTLYPGQREVAGGTVAWRHWLSLWLPAVNFDRNYDSTIGENISEIGTVGLAYALLVACTLDYARWRELFADPDRRRLVVLLGIVFAALLAWMALPLPSAVGAPLLWDRVPPVRMHFAAGLAFVALLLVAALALGLRLSWPRMAVFAAIVVAGWWKWKSSAAGSGVEDLVILPLAVVAFVVARRRPDVAHAALLAASTVAGAWIFAGFNPLQTAWPIFARQPTPATAALDQLASSNGGVLAIVGLPGATANGLGYRAVNHVNAVPQFAYWRERFPALDEAEFRRIFNRYAHIVPGAEFGPRLVRFDAVFVPHARFVAVGDVRPAERFDFASRDGAIDTAKIEDRTLVLWGWGPWSGPAAGHDLEFAIEPAPSAAPARGIVLRADLVAHLRRDEAALNGFVLRVPLGAAGHLPATCLFARDGAGNRVLLHNPPTLPVCAAASPR